MTADPSRVAQFPFWIQVEQRPVRQHDNSRIILHLFQVGLQPQQLLVADAPEGSETLSRLMK